MKSAQEVILYSLKQGTASERLMAILQLAIDRDARRTASRVKKVAAMFQLAFDDEFYVVQTKETQSPVLVKLLLLVVLVGIAIYEWKSYSWDAISPWVKMLLRRCGLE